MSSRSKKKETHLDSIIQAKKSAFLEAFKLVGTISAAARSAQIGRQTHYDWKASDEEYARAFADSTQEAAERLEQEARRRAVVGVDKPLVYRGQITRDAKTGQPVTVKEYSDTLLIFLMKGAMPEKYGDWDRPHMPTINVEKAVIVIGGNEGEYVRGMRDARGSNSGPAPGYRTLAGNRR